MEYKIKNMKNYYFGILLVFIAKMFIDTTECVLYMLVDFFNLSIWVTPSVLVIFCAVIVYLLLFYRIENLTLKPLVFVLILITCMLLSQLFSYGDFLANYSKYQIGLNYSITKLIEYLFMLSLGIIAYIKYYCVKDK